VDHGAFLYSEAMMGGTGLRLLAAMCAIGLACAAPPPASPPRTREASSGSGGAAERDHMVRSQIESRGVKDPEVLRALRVVPRHAFVPEALRAAAHDDRPLPIGEGQTISQPYIVALMTELARPAGGSKVLEVGTGSGYQAAVLAEMKAEVWSIEIVPELARRARVTLDALGYGSVRTRVGDGYAGWPEAAPFDAIVVTAAPDHVPQPLIDQLAAGGRLVIPVGREFQSLTVLTRTGSGVTREEVLPVRFVPMTGEAQRPRP
jgi:protein-L-isoaspartate(D-aspartate) O-methyltransferase